MDVFKITAVGIIAVCACLLLKGTRPEIAVLISLAAAGIIMFYSLPQLKNLIGSMENLTEYMGIDSAYITPVFKAVGISYVTQIGSDIARDSGERAVASKIDFAGKIAVMSLALPIAYKMISLVNGIIFSG